MAKHLEATRAYYYEASWRKMFGCFHDLITFGAKG